MKKNAYVLFGGIGSGKTTLANSLEMRDKVLVIGTDRLIYEKDLKARDNIKFDTYEERNRGIAESTNPNVVFDEMVKPSSLEPIINAGYTITALHLNISDNVRKSRFQQRIFYQTDILEKLSEIVGIDLLAYDRESRRVLWRDKAFYDRIPWKRRDEFDRLLKEMYYSGGTFLTNRKPAPLDYTGIDYVVELNDNDQLGEVVLSKLQTKKIPYKRYHNERRGKSIELCIWDIGNVLYDYSLSPFFELARKMSRSPDDVENALKEFSFNSYMRGEISFSILCKQFCHAFNVPYSISLEAEIESAFRKGIGKSHDVSRKVILQFKAKGIKNAILSNALPILEEDGDYHDLFPKEVMFYSFRTGYLKPEEKAYTAVLSSLGVLPEDTLFIDDKARNVLAAIKLGITGIVFSPTTFEEDVYYQLRYTSDECASAAAKLGGDI